MGENDKQLKLGIVIDEPSFRKAQNELKALTAELQRTIEASARLQSSIAGISTGTGGHGGANMAIAGILGTAVPTPGSAVQGAQAAAQGGGGGGQTRIGAPTGLVDTVSQVRNLLRGAADGGRDAMRDLGTEVRRFSEQAVRDLEKVKSAAGGVDDMFSQAADRMGGGAVGGEGAVRTQAGVGVREVAQAASGGLIGPGAGGQMTQQQLAALLTGQTPSAGMGAGPGGPTFGSKVMGFLNQDVSQNAGGLLSVGGLARAAGVASYLAPAYAGLKVTQAIVGSTEANDVANAKHYMFSVMQPSQMMAAQGGVRAMGEQIRRGNIGMGLAASQVLQSPEYRKLFGANMAQNATDVALAEAGYGTGAGMSRAYERLTTTKENGTLFGGLSQQAGRAGQYTNQIRLDEAIAQMAPERLAQFQQQVQAKVAEDPRMQQMLGDLWSGAGGRLAFQRQIAIVGTHTALGRGGGGVGAGVDKPAWQMGDDEFSSTRKLAPWQQYQVDALKKYHTTAEQLAALGSQIQASAGRRYAGMERGLIGAQMGGFTNVAQVYGTSTQFGDVGNIAAGARDPGGFYHAAQSIMGSGGMDVTAGAQLSGAVGNIMAGSGDFMGANGGALLQGLGSAAYTGRPGGDMFMTGVLTQGMQAYGQSHSGLESGITHLTAMQVSGGNYNMATALERLSPEMKIQIMRTGKVPEMFQRAGITADKVRELESKSSMMFADFVPIGNTATENAVRGFQSSGMSLPDFLKSRAPKGTSFKTDAGRKWLRSELQTFGYAYSLSHPGLSAKQSWGMVEAMVAGDATLRPALGGRGAGDPIRKGSVEAAAVEGAGDVLQKDFEFQNENEATAKGALATRPGSAKAVKTVADKGPQGVYTDAADALLAAAAALRKIGNSSAYSTGVDSANKYAKPNQGGK